MTTHAAKTPSPAGHAAANDLAQQPGAAAAGLVDNRAGAVAQRQAQHLINSSPQAQQAAQLQKMADSRGNQPPVQRQATADVAQLMPKGNKGTQARAANRAIKGRKKHHVRPEYASRNQRERQLIGAGAAGGGPVDRRAARRQARQEEREEKKQG